MKYNFDRIIERRDTASIKWDFADAFLGCGDALPMWVADMDFMCPQPVIDALLERTKHGVYGYTGHTEAFHNAIMNWLERRHGWKIEKDWICTTPGVVPALAFSIMAYTKPGDRVLIQTPVYRPFFEVIQANEREVVENSLIYRDGSYFMDFEDLEKKLKEGVSLVILCHPHNPVGRVWNEDELRKFGELCLKYNVPLISDDIHSDIIFKPNRYTPIAKLDDRILQNSITCFAPSKTFNLAGLTASFIVIPDKEMREKFNNVLFRTAVYIGNLYGAIGLQSAYDEGEEWLEQLLEYLAGNLCYMKEFFIDKLPQIKLIEPEGTYLAWLDCRELRLSDKELELLWFEKAKVAPDPGTIFGENGSGFARINFACPRSVLKTALDRLKQAVEDLLHE